MALKLRITDNLVRDLPNDVTRINDNQISGFHLRIGRSNTQGSRLISYYCYYRLGGRNGRQVNFLIGNSAIISAGDARRIALKIVSLIAEGKDPQKLQFEQQKQPVKLKQFWHYFAKEIVTKKYKNPQDPIRNIETIILPAIGSVALDKISHQLVELRIVELLLRTFRPSYINIVTSQLKTLLRLAVEQGLIATQPLGSFRHLGPSQDSTLAQVAPLSGAQLKGIYYRAAKEPRKSVYLYCLRLQILTGQPLSVICSSYRQDIKGNKWLLRASDGKLTGRVIPLSGPLKQLFKEILKLFPKLDSLYLLPGNNRSKVAVTNNDGAMDIRAIAKAQKKFIAKVHHINLSQRALLNQIEQAMLALGINPLAVVYLFDKNVEASLRLAADDPEISSALARWYLG